MYAKIISIALLVIAGSQANVVPTDENECPIVCPAIYAPVCATNGDRNTEFSNSCILETTNCRMTRANMKPYTQIDIAWCTSKLVDNLDAIFGDLDLNRPECVRPCPMIYAPVCATDGKYRTTVSSTCVLDMYNCVLNLKGTADIYRILQQGSC